MMKKIKRNITFFMVLLMTVFSTHIDAYAANQYKGGIVIEDDAPKVVEEGLMPSTGDVKAAVLMAEFPDSESVTSKEEVEAKMFGATESLSSYYKTSSYNKLNISGDVYDWYTAQNNRESYEDSTKEYPPAEVLFREVVSAMDSQVDFSKYDSDNDGYVDAVYLMFSGDDISYSTMWWAYQKDAVEEIEVDGKKIASYVFIPETYSDYKVIAHETGHLMGLQDYYDTEKNVFGGGAYYGTESLMCTSAGELDVLSKWMLGWLTPQIVTEDTTISLRPSNEYPDAAVVKIKEEDMDDSFFLVEYRTPTKNNETCQIELNGVSVYRVNAKVDSSTGKYKYDVSADDVRLIEGAVIDVTEGYAIGTTQVPTSYVISEEDGVTSYSATGITIDNISIAEGNASIEISYEDVSELAPLKMETSQIITDSRACYTLKFSSEVNCDGTLLYAVSGDKKIPLAVNRDNYGRAKNLNEYYIYTTEELEKNKTYSITIPEAIFTSFDGRDNEQLELEFTTDNYDYIGEIEKSSQSSASTHISSTLPYGTDGYVYFSNSSGTIYMNTVDSSGQSNQIQLHTMGDYVFDDLAGNFTTQACLLDDGNYVVVGRYYSDHAILKVSPDGDCEYIGNQELEYAQICCAIGNKAYIGRKDENTCIILDENNQLQEIEDSFTYEPYIKCTESYYSNRTYGVDNTYYIDEDFNLINTITKEAFYIYTKGTDYKNGKFVRVEFNAVERKYYECIYSASGNLESRRLLFSGIGEHNMVAIEDMYRCDYGYIFTGSVELAYNNVNGEGIFSGVVASPVATVMVTDKDYNKIYNYTIDYGEFDMGDEIESVLVMNDGSIICSTSWSDYKFGGPKESDQHTHNYDENNVCIDCGYKLVIEYFEHTHSYDDCEDNSCNSCGETRTAPGHRYTDCEDQTCEEGCGITRNPVEHEYIDCEDESCENCDATRIAPGHNYIEQSDGSKICSECGDVVEPTTPPSGDDPVTPPSQDESITPPTVNVYYRTHIQSFGWEGEANKVSTWRKNGDMSGTSGKAKRLEGIEIEVASAEAGKEVELGIQYTTHCQSYGWLPWSASGEMSGTSGEAKRLEAIKIQLTGADKDKYDVYYRVHAQSYGWLGWAKNGAPSGTAGYGKRLEGIQVVVVKKDENFDKNMGGITSVKTEAYVAKSGSSPVLGQAATDALNPIIYGAEAPYVMYKTHVQSYGWQQWVLNGGMSGTSGQAKRLEGINIKLSNAPYDGDIVYTTHVQTYGWQGKPGDATRAGWKKNGEMSGTSGEAKRLEAICIDLTGEMSDKYDVYYRVHAQSFGWLGWAKNGEESGTAGYAKRLEGIQIVLVPKGGAKPADNYGGIISVDSRAYVEK